ncbi:hypothetical protein [Mucilaginibacter myungsuensis]|uniref:Uncharacterized protein n=1 Tax=Mucilaginibacter myungsuensis TaxID=649104 RepID=A0A929L032_9SPHI|nr:hypothetical protein [Mucilaginibacter myungsuensis]MBE9662024.1 hypothetical protein [Mucilaginibacter myungsuensis]MDN3599543.1 hypothetical protein [Mucilaginibacter myungsuensis]
MKKYILKPGKHQFAPGGEAVHDNDNLTDAEAEWYLERYPHIAGLFVERLESLNVEKLPAVKRYRSRKSKGKTTIELSNISTLQHSNEENENLPSTN